jgi:hypothetical protein
MKHVMTGLITAAFLASGSLFATPAGAQQKLVLKAADVHPLGYPSRRWSGSARSSSRRRAAA